MSSAPCGNDFIAAQAALGQFVEQGDVTNALASVQWPQCQHAWYVRLKAPVEWIAALTLLVICLPLLLILILLVKSTSTGPAFYAQTRLGRFGRPYRMFKLRTMVHNAEGATGPVWAVMNDGRVTPVGRFLRTTHLDELPQFFNVLLGDMALIGPRPERPEIALRIQKHVPDFSLRLAMRPGVTGFAQVLLPADDPNDSHFCGIRKKLAHDLYYLRKMSFAMDLRILFCTACYLSSAASEFLRHFVIRSDQAAVTPEIQLPDDIATKVA